MKTLATIGIIIILSLAAVGAFAIYGGIRQWRISRRSQSRLDKDIERFQKLNRKYNTKNTSNAKKD